MTRQVSDQLYIDLGYYNPEEYYVYTAEAESSLDLVSSLGCDANVIAGGEIVMASVEFATISCTISHIHGSDLFAFSEAAIAVQIDRIRDTNTAATAVFDIATDGRRFRDITSDDEAVFSIDVVNARSRDVDLSAEAAFSLAADNTRLKLYASDLVSESTVFAVISNVKGVDILQQNFALMDIVAEKIVNGIATLNTTSTIAFAGGLIVTAASAIRAHASVFVSRYVATGRPRNLTGGVFNTIAKFGSHSISNRRTSSVYANTTPRVNDDWVAEYWFYTVASTVTGTITLQTEWLQWVISNTNLTTSKDFIVRLNGIDIYNERRTSIANSVWRHIALVKTSTTVSGYLDGTRIFTTTAPTSYLNDGFTLISVGSSFTGGYQDEASLRVGDTYGYSASSTTITVPTSARTNDPTTTRFLYHFDNNGLDDTSGIVQTVQAGLTSAATISAQLSGPQRTSASLTATASIVSNISVDRGVEITVDNFATLTADVTHIKSLDSDLDSEFNADVTPNYIFGSLADLTVDSQTVIDSERGRGFTIFTDAVGVIVAVSAKVGAFFINAEIDSIFAVDADKTTDIISTLTVDSNTSILGEKIGSLEATVDSVSALESNADRTRDVLTSIDTTADINIESSNILDLHADLASEFMLMADASGGTIRATLVAESFASLSAQAESTLSAQGNLTSLFTVSADTEDSLTVRIVSDMFSQGQVLADNDRLRDNIIVTESVASNLVVVVKTTDADILLASTLELSASVDKIAGYTAELATDASVSALGSLTQALSAELASQVTVSAIGRTSSDAAADLVSSTTLSAIGVKGTEILLQAFTNAGLTLDANVIREVTVEQSATAELSADADRTRSSLVELLAFSVQLTVGTKQLDAIALTIGEFTLSVNTSIVHIREYVYKIPREGRTYTIQTETRLRNIAVETRYYKIK